MSVAAKAISAFESTFKSTKSVPVAAAPNSAVFDGLVKSTAAKKAAKFASTKDKKAAAKPVSARMDFSGNFKVKDAAQAQRGFLLEYVAYAGKLKVVTREKMNAKFAAQEDHVRLMRYFAYCVHNGIFAATK